MTVISLILRFYEQFLANLYILADQYYGKKLEEKKSTLKKKHIDRGQNGSTTYCNSRKPSNVQEKLRK